jgi:hypothetical protein
MEACLRVMVYQYPELNQTEFTQLKAEVVKRVQEQRAKYEKEVKVSKNMHELKCKLPVILYKIETN